MQKFSEAIERVANFAVSWFNFSRLLILCTFYIPVMIVLAVILTVLPFAYLFFALQAPLWATAYMFAVFVGVGLYCIFHSAQDRNMLEDPDDGRSMTTEGKATTRGRSKIRDSFLDD